MMRILSVTLLLFLVAVQIAFAAGPRVDIVIGEKAPALEKRAAEDIAANLRKVYDAEVKIAADAPKDAENVIFVASTKSDEQIWKLLSLHWPKLSTQGHALRSIKFRERPALLVAGGSPAAAYWGAAEFAQQLGIRPMLYGDLYPIDPPPLSDFLKNLDVLAEPEMKDRIWAMDTLPIDQGSWSLDEQKRLLRQLAQLKYNRLIIFDHPWQPFVHFEFDGVKKKTGVLWYGWQFPVSGDTAGRAAFKGGRLFENPDFAGKTTYEQRLEVGQNLVRGLIEEAQSLGMSVGLGIDPLAFPKEFASVCPGARPLPEPVELSVTPSPDQKLDDEKLLKLTKAQLRAYINAYPDLDTFYFSGDSADKMATLLTSDNKLLLRKDGKSLNVISVGGETQKIPFTLVSDFNFLAYAGSRRAFNIKGVAQGFECRDLVMPVCGEGVDGSVIKALFQMVSAKALIDNNDPRFHVLVPGVILKHYASSDPPPEWWSQVRANYLGAMNDMYRANSRAREGGRSYTLYLARRCEFGYEYMNCVDATRKAGIAKSKKDTAEQRAQLEKAVESMNAACSALAAVARDQSDRGMIAVCNEFGYRPLQKELEKLDSDETK